MLAWGRMSEPVETPDAAPEAEPPRRKKKKRKKAATAAAPRDRLDAQGRERPTFLLAFPHDPELDRLIAAFEAGNYRMVREEAPALAERAQDPAVRDAALELVRRIDPDPLMKYLLLVAVLLLGFLTTWAYGHH